MCFQSLLLFSVTSKELRAQSIWTGCRDAGTSAQQLEKDGAEASWGAQQSLFCLCCAVLCSLRRSVSFLGLLSPKVFKRRITINILKGFIFYRACLFSPPSSLSICSTWGMKLQEEKDDFMVKSEHHLCGGTGFCLLPRISVKNCTHHIHELFHSDSSFLVCGTQLGTRARHAEVELISVEVVVKTNKSVI